MGRHGGSIVTDQTDTKRKHKKIHRRKSFRPDGMIWLNDSTKMNCPQSTYTLLLKVTLTLSYLCSVNELSSFVNVLSYVELYREKKQDRDFTSREVNSRNSSHRVLLVHVLGFSTFLFQAKYLLYSLFLFLLLVVLLLLLLLGTDFIETIFFFT